MSTTPTSRDAAERTLAAFYVVSGSPSHKRFPAASFTDPLAASILAALERFEQAGRTPSPQKVAAEVGRGMPSLAEDAKSILFDPSAHENSPEKIAELVETIRAGSVSRHVPSAAAKTAPLPITPETVTASIGDERIKSERVLQSKPDADSSATPFLQLWSPSQCREWEMPPDFVLAGDCHLTRGGIAVIGGVPGCGKSRALVGLAIAGATGQSWMGLPLHSKFRTMIIQAENGPARLKAEFSDIKTPVGVDLDEFIRITPAPDYGLPLLDPAFQREMRDHIAAFRPAVIGLDPWNRITLDDKQKDYRAAIDCILSCLPEAPSERPAVVIVAHLRKRVASDSRKWGRDLLPELSGSVVIGSAARSVFILEPASPDPLDDRVVWTCAKNNDGAEGPSSAWHRRNGLFEQCDEFDFEEFLSAGAPGGRVTINESDVKNALAGGVPKKDAVKRLIEATKCGSSAAYAAVALNGRFASKIDEADGLLIWTGK
ncbi:MAG: AAA family ATPase [Verrucomicrobiae bacterium]|nr:AAA family ATPase [Verrucomicrobiae bacterium]